MSFNESVAQIKLNLFTHHIPLPQVVFNVTFGPETALHTHRKVRRQALHKLSPQMSLNFVFFTAG